MRNLYLTSCPLLVLFFSPVAARRGLWPVLLHSMNIKAEEFIEKNLESILPHLLEVNADNQVWKQHISMFHTYIFVVLFCLKKMNCRISASVLWFGPCWYLVNATRELMCNLSPQAVKNAVGALSSISPIKLLPRIISHVTEGLSRPDLLQVTREEFDIMLTPEGELYDNSIIQR